MAVKFSEFTQKANATTASVTEIVGYLSTGELNVRVVPSALDTTYTYATTNGTTPALTLAGTKAGVTITDSIVTLSSGGSVLLAGTGTNAISITATTYILSAGDSVVGNNNVPIKLTGTDGSDAHVDTLNVVGTGTVQVSSSSGTITIAGTTGSGTVTGIGMTVPAAFAVTPASINTSGTFIISGAGSASQVVLGDGTLGTLPTDTNTTYDLTSQASGTSVDVNLVPSTGTTDTIKLTPAGGLTITKSGDVITLDTSASGTGTVTNVTSADTNTITVASGTTTPTITAVTSGGVGSGSTSLATGAQIQAAINTAVAGLLDYKGGYNALTNTPDLDSGSNIAILKGDAYTVTVAGTFFTEAVGIGDLLIANEDMAIGGSLLTKWTTVQNNVGTAQVGATDAATAKGIAGFDNQMFATTANGFITSTTLNEIPITVQSVGANNYYFVDGIQQSPITLLPDVTYLINVSDASVNTHPFILTETSGGGASATAYTTGVVYLVNNAPVNQASWESSFSSTTTRKLRVTLTQTAPVLYYGCAVHANMGANISAGGGVTMTTSPAATGNGSTALYPLGVTPKDKNYTMAYISGVYQLKSSYGVSGSNITFDTNVPNGASIEIVTTT